MHQNRTRRRTHTNQPDRSKPVTKSQAAFVPKLFSILEEEDQNLISWSNKGERFMVSNPITFSKFILPQHFKHNNWQSFVRQLNMYGFNKCNDSERAGLVWEFRHPNFRKSRPDLLPLIKRRSSRTATTTTSSTTTPTPTTTTTTKRTRPYDPVRDPAGVIITGPGKEKISDVLRMMLNLISNLSNDIESPINEQRMFLFN
ncbi:hypothetical protein CROQUDRAFT_63694 [Cronartium quercuum f. sp. fusiforme G11]|uniref:HSF-type DNA-binding domain-containing protein n=1 Tax=Cronartium quercuum f. sp. fusiforme G11 TaxID=708437 RepID=A0A9P6NLA3_9BASI|nr:hypothetical protein CROQUDRAFT_63694 [Cronartium quercuum f. sp. fusiforme G11]